MAGEQVTVPVSVPVQTNARDAASDVETLRESIDGSLAEIRAMSGSLRQLRGSTDDIKAAKAQLTTKINALKDSVSASTLALTKQGTSYDAASQKAKKQATEQRKLAEEQKKLADTKAADKQNALASALGKAGGPLKSLTSGMGELSEMFGSAATGEVLMAGGAALVVAGMVALIAAVATGTYKLAKFVLVAADLARSAGLKREAWSGTAENAGRLGDQVDDLARRLPTAKAELNALAIDLMKMKLSGQATVDTFNAVGQASAALGDEAGKKLQEFITRGRMVGRLQINPAEMLEGFGNLNFDDVAESLAAGMNISTAAAKKALYEGRVKIDDGAKAIREAVEKRFGGINLRQMMSFENLSKKADEALQGLTKGVTLDPLVAPMKEFTALLGDSTVTGQTLKMIMTTFGNDLVSVLKEGIPVATALFQGMVIGALELYIRYLQVKRALKEAFGDSTLLKNVDGLTLAVDAGTIAIKAIGVACLMTAGFAAAVAAPFVILGLAIAGVAVGVALGIEAVWELGKAVFNAGQDLAKATTEWRRMGADLVDGFVQGIKAKVESAVDAVKDLGEKAKNALKEKLNLHSPSKVFAEYGENTAEGYAQGVQKGSGRAAAATEGLGSGAPQGAAGGRGGGNTIHINIDARGADREAVDRLSDDSFLAKLTKAAEDACASSGISPSLSVGVGLP